MNALPSFVTILHGAQVFGRGDALSEEARLLELLGAYGIEAEIDKVSLLLRHLELLEEKNATTNLTRIAPGSDALIAHVLDSLLPLPYLCQLTDGTRVSFVDIGTGGGFPGLPLACMTDWDATLIDSVGKKTDAVSDFIDALGLESRARALHVRAEDLARKEPGAYNLVVTRAVAQSNVLLEYASPLLSDGGLLVLYKARPTPEELEAADRASSLCGMKLVSRETFDLPENTGHRELLYFKKVGKPRIRLPRRTGLASKEPLGL